MIAAARYALYNDPVKSQFLHPGAKAGSGSLPICCLRICPSKSRLLLGGSLHVSARRNELPCRQIPLSCFENQTSNSDHSITVRHSDLTPITQHESLVQNDVFCQINAKRARCYASCSILQALY